MVQQWSKFDEIQENIEELDPSEETRTYEIRERYYAVASRAKQLINSRTATSSSYPPTKPIIAPMTITLPEMKLPTFDGAPEAWASFFDVFTSVIDRNKELTPVQKLQYLRSTLRGKAAACIESLATTDANYLDALELLKERFDNQRLIIMRHCRAILELPKLTRDSPDGLENLVNTVKQNLRALKNLGEPTTAWSSLLVTSILSKVNSNTVWHWELTLKDKTMPVYTDLLDFLEKCANCAPQTTERTTSPRTNNTARRQVFLTSSRCPICKANHEVRRCQQFRSQPIHERIKSVKRAALCTNCLQMGHALQDCSSGTCRICDERHNTLLHQPPGGREKAAPDSSASTSSVATPSAI